MRRWVVAGGLLLVGCHAAEWERLHGLLSERIKIRVEWVDSPGVPPVETVVPAEEPVVVLPLPPAVTPEPAPTPVPRATPSPKSSPDALGCTDYQPARDGYKHGFIFLQSHTQKVAKAVLPSRYDVEFPAVVVQSRRGAVLDRAVFTGFANPDGTGRKRQHWKFTKSATSFPDHSVVRAGSVCWRLGRVSERVD